MKTLDSCTGWPLMRINLRVSDVVWGMRGGVLVALVYCAWITLIYVFHGQSAFDRQGVTYEATLAFYLGAGAISGAIAGVLRPLLRFRFGAYCVGVVAALPIGFGTAVIVSEA